MSYIKQAEKINFNFKIVLEGNPDKVGIKTFNILIDTILWFGQVAKFRCKSNKSYDNFAKLCFLGIVELERTQIEGKTFDILQVKP